MIMKKKTNELGVTVQIDMNNLFESNSEMAYPNFQETVQSYYIKFDE